MIDELEPKRPDSMPREEHMRLEGKCMRCEILLKSEFAGKTKEGYCEDCYNKI